MEMGMRMRMRMMVNIGEHLLFAYYMPGTNLNALHVLILLILCGFPFLNINVAFCHNGDQKKVGKEV